jgi:hypothetical protein
MPGHCWREYDPATPYNLRYAYSDVLSFVTTTIGHAAGVSALDSPRPRFEKLIPSQDSDEFDESIEETAG